MPASRPQGGAEKAGGWQEAEDTGMAMRGKRSVATACGGGLTTWQGHGQAAPQELG